jgi:hypothetical protein
MKTRDLRLLSIGIAATLMALLVLLPASYHFGKATALQRSPELVAESDSTATSTATAANGPDGDNEPVIHEAVDQEVSPQVDVIEPVVVPSAIELAMNTTANKWRRDWMNPLANIARSTRLDRQSESMVTISHASLFALDNSIRNLSEFPFSVAASGRPSRPQQADAVDSDIDTPRRTLAVGDFNALTFGLEATR